MREFFHGWRRKAGCVTLVMAISLMAGWMRSLYPHVPSPVPGQFVFDEQGWEIGYSFHRVGHAVHRFSLKDSCMTWERIQADAPIMVNNVIGVWLNASATNFPDVGIQSNAWIAKQEWCGFARGRFHLKDGRFNLRIARLVLPFWAIVIPLTLLSAYLLLWKPRKRPTKQSAPE